MHFMDSLSSSRRNRKLRSKIEKSWAQYWFLPTVALLVLWLLWSKVSEPVFVDIEVSSQKPGIAQIFWDDGSGFREEHSAKIELPEENRKISLKIPFSNKVVLQSLRVDPVNNDGLVTIHRLNVKSSGYWFASSVLQPEYGAYHGIARWQWNAAKKELLIVPEAGNSDPYFTVENPTLPMESIARWIKLTTTSLVVFVIFVIFSWAASQFLLSSLVRMLRSLMAPIRGLKWITNRYTRWVDRFSDRWGLVAPTSCVAGALVVATIVYFSTNEFRGGTSYPREGKFEVTVESGEANSLGLYYETRNGLQLRDLKWVTFEKLKTPHRLNFEFAKNVGPITGFRIDPLEGPGSVRLSNAKWVSPSGRVDSVSLSGWVANSDAMIVVKNEHSLELKSLGNDPYIRVQGLDLSVQTGSTVPVDVGLPILVFSLCFMVFAIYNHLVTEGMSRMEIRQALEK